MEGIKLFPRSKPLCRLSEPSNPHNLCRRSDPPLSVCFVCKGQHLEDKRYYYYCATCDLEFHRGCHFYPPKIRHPFHLLHPLTLTFLDPDFPRSEIPIGWVYSTSESENLDPYVRTLKSISDGNHAKCIFCRTNLQNEEEDAYYHCSTCNFSIHCRCSMIQPPLTIENFKRHDHTLTLFPRQVPLPCDACGLSLDAPFDHNYSCLLCNYMVHRRCNYLPGVIKITRHPHRLSHTSSLVVSSGDFSCGVCRKTVDVGYGSYSCNKGCHYAVHSRCATKVEVWDGIDYEEASDEEEEEKEEIIEPFVRIDEETIQHFSHDQHHLKIHWNGSHENKFCQACILPITVSDRFYSCIKCEFVLHETCASLPRKIHHPVHKHPLTLFHPFSSNPHELETKYYRKGFFTCKGCNRRCCGFMYKCSVKDCDFHLDVRCTSLPDPLIHDCHPHDHPLFFSLNHGKCMGCKSTPSSTVSRQSKRGYFKSTCRYTRKYLECMKCDSFLCLQCATLPSVAHYKHDKHPLTLCYGEETTTDLQYWCEICERKLDATTWFYTCKSCTVTLHVKCLSFGREMYMKPNHTINLHGTTVDIACNSGHSRPVCDGCGRRCIYALVFKCAAEVFCRVSCLLDSIRGTGTIYTIYI